MHHNPSYFCAPKRRVKPNKYINDCRNIFENAKTSFTHTLLYGRTSGKKEIDSQTCECTIDVTTEPAK